MRFFDELKQKINCKLRNKHVILKIKHDGGTEEGVCIFCDKLVYRMVKYQNSETSGLKRRKI